MAIGLRDNPEPMGERTPERETLHIRLRCLGVDGHEVDVDFVDELGAGSAVGVVVVETVLEQRIALAIEVGFGDVSVAPQECRNDFAVGQGVDVGGVLRHTGIYDLRIYDGRFVIYDLAGAVWQNRQRYRVLHTTLSDITVVFPTHNMATITFPLALSAAAVYQFMVP